MSNAEERTFTEAEHFALLTDRVARETADLTAERDRLQASLDEVQQRVDVLEAEKATAVSERDAVATEFAEFRAELERQAEVAELRETRVKAVRDAAPGLPDEYFTPERAERWAVMAEDAFAAFLADLSPVAPTKAAEETTPRQTAAFSQGSAPSTSTGSVKQLLAFRRGA